MTRTKFVSVVEWLAGYPANHPRLTLSDIATYADEAFLFMAEAIVPARLLAVATVETEQDVASYPIAGALRINSVSLGGEFLPKMTLEQIGVVLPDWQQSGPSRFFLEEGVETGAALRLFPPPESAQSLSVGFLKQPKAFLSYEATEELFEWRGYMASVAAYYATWRFLMNGTEFVAEERLSRLQAAWERGVAQLAGWESPDATIAQQGQARDNWRRT